MQCLVKGETLVIVPDASARTMQKILCVFDMFFFVARHGTVRYSHSYCNNSVIEYFKVT